VIFFYILIYDMNRSQKLLVAYADTVLTREVKVSSRAAYGRRLALLYKLGDWCKGKVTVEGCEAWVEWLQKNYTGATVKQTLALARGFWVYCLELGCVKGKNPFLTVSVQNTNNLPPPPTPAHYVNTKVVLNVIV
jgi:hypothetical protein